jgi:hypothetical protein
LHSSFGVNEVMASMVAAQARCASKNSVMSPVQTSSVVSCRSVQPVAGVALHPGAALAELAAPADGAREDAVGAARSLEDISID